MDDPDDFLTGEFKPCAFESREAGVTTYLHEDVPYVAHHMTAPDGSKAHWVDALLAMDDGRLVGVNFWFCARKTKPPEPPVEEVVADYFAGVIDLKGPLT